MKIERLKVKSQKLWIISFIFGVVMGTDLPKGPASDGGAMREAFGAIVRVDMQTALKKRQAASEGVDLGQSFINAYEANDESRMKLLVKVNKSSVSKELIDMITYATSGEVSSEEMTWLIKITDKMAAIYYNEFSDKRLETFVSNYKKWSQREQKRKKEADNIFYSYKMEIKNKNYDAVVEKWDQSLDMYREIGDKLGEAKRLNEIGITFGKLGSYKTSIKFLNDARQINNEIGNVRGEVSDLRFIAAGYVALEDYTQAIEIYKTALNIVGDLGDKAQKDTLLNDIAGIEGRIRMTAGIKD